MRTIKFRGKHPHIAEWCFGNLVDYGDGRMEIHGFGVFPDGDNDWHEIEVAPDSVGQFTGMKDKNGKEIYEGDILGAKGVAIGWVRGGVRVYCYDVVYVNNPAGESRWTLYSTVKDDYPEQIDVIGNIYDNPELLEGGGNPIDRAVNR